MKKCIKAGIALLSILCLCGCGEAQTVVQEVTKHETTVVAEVMTSQAQVVYAQCIDSVVHIENASGGGTGFFVAEDIVATNHHVIADAQWMTVKKQDGSIYNVLSVIADSENPDLALLKVDCTGTPIKKNSHGVSAGEAVYTIGAPMGIYPSISDGIVMKPSHWDNEVDYILSNFHAIGGNSGGPLFNAYGELMGIVVGGMMDGANSIDMVISAAHLDELEQCEPRILMTKEEYEAQMNRPEEEKYERCDIADAKPGMLVSFGHYEQDGDTANGAEEILWLVREKNGNELQLMSLYCLDAMPYHNTFEAVTWETSDIRRFLNGAFLTNAFTVIEQQKLQTVTVHTQDNPLHGTSGGNDTLDRVYLQELSDVMADYGITEPEERFYDQIYAQATPYTVSKGVWLEIENSNRCWWWLRSPGGCQENAAEVGSAGYLSFNGSQVDEPARAIRPIIHITAE